MTLRIPYMSSEKILIGIDKAVVFVLSNFLCNVYSARCDQVKLGFSGVK